MTIGILGGGQLGRMLALAGYPLGLRFRFLDANAASPAGHLAELMTSDITDGGALGRFADGLEVATYEFENVPVDTARRLKTKVPVYPPPEALEVAQDRLAEKTCFRNLEIPTPIFVQVDTREELDRAIEVTGLPAVLKTRRFGYDGKGQIVLKQPAGVDTAWKLLGGSALILEAFVPFDREVSLLAVRGKDGEQAFYPLVENHHHEGILRLSLAPAPDSNAQLQALAEEYAGRVLNALNYTGVLAIEFFQIGDSLVANEMAPRVHNSGHWTIEGAHTSQFENHLRAILGLPLGSTALRGECAMWNLIGEAPDVQTVLKMPYAHLHLYGKSGAPGRKIGHVTLCAADWETRQAQLRVLGWQAKEI